jgi:antibiotic biosynthesis monooxygenase (ABM) superfamily enzyme
MTPPQEDHPVTVVVRRRTKPGCEAEFEAAMRDFVAFALSSPGNRGINVLRSDEAHPREYTVVDRFADGASRRDFTSSSAYHEWMVRLRTLTEEDPHIEETGGLSGWFTLPGHPAAGPPPPIKMAFTTFLGVYPLTSILPRLGGRLLHGLHPLIINVFVTGLIVILLTWVIMPNLTRLFRPWLFPSKSKSS